MPTYRAGGVTATLCIADLKATLATSNEYKILKTLEAENSRIAKAFSNGTTLLERPIAADGGERGIMQFIGEFADIPFFMVEAGGSVGSEAPPSSSHNPQPTHALIELISPGLAQFANLQEDHSFSIDSSLTSLGATPVFGTPQESFNELPPNAYGAVHEDPTMADAPPDTFHTPPQLAIPLDGDGTLEIDGHGLRLAIQTSALTHKPKPDSNAMTDLKIEVFLNGHLAAVHFINVKRYSTENTTYFQGSRIHRQVEKPWLYRASNSPQGNWDAAHRWNVVGALLKKEAEKRGIDGKGTCPPSAEFLAALQDVPLPERLRDQKQLGLLDVVITCGRGSKKGFADIFETRPARLKDKRFLCQGLPAVSETSTSSTTPSDDVVAEGTMLRPASNVPEPLAAPQSFSVGMSAVDDPFTTTRASTMGLSSTDAFLAPQLSIALSRSSSPAKAQGAAQAFEPKSSSSDMPLAKRRRADTKVSVAATPQSQSKKAKEEKADKDRAFAAELGMTLENGVDLDTWITREHLNGARRTVGQCLGHIKQMGRAKRRNAVELLLRDIANSAEIKGSTPVESSARTGHTAAMAAAPPPVMSLNVMRQRANQTQEVSMQLGQPAQGATPNEPPQDQISLLAQVRTDMAIENGVPTNGYLLDRIASRSPHRSPIKRQILPPVGQPAEELLKETSVLSDFSRRDSVFSAANRSHSTQAEKLSDEFDSRRGFTAPGLSEIVPETSWIQDTEDGEAAVKAFRAPQTCEGSVLTFAGSDTQRQITKTRPGEFEEHELIVGMRFVVV